VVGSKKGGFIGIYEIERDFSVNHVDTFRVDPKCTAVTGLSVSTDKSHLVISSLLQEEVMAGGELPSGETKLNRVELYQLNLQQLSVSKNIFSLPIKQVFQKGNPIGSLIDLDVGVSKDLIVSAGQDNYIRIFEYKGNGQVTEAS
jgi:hypothetical protein